MKRIKRVFLALAMLGLGALVYSQCAPLAQAGQKEVSEALQVAKKSLQEAQQKMRAIPANPRTSAYVTAKAEADRAVQAASAARQQWINAQKQAELELSQNAQAERSMQTSQIARHNRQAEDSMQRVKDVRQKELTDSQNAQAEQSMQKVNDVRQKELTDSQNAQAEQSMQRVKDVRQKELTDSQNAQAEQSMQKVKQVREDEAKQAAAEQKKFEDQQNKAATDSMAAVEKARKDDARAAAEQGKSSKGYTDAYGNKGKEIQPEDETAKSYELSGKCATIITGGKTFTAPSKQDAAKACTQAAMNYQKAAAAACNEKGQDSSYNGFKSARDAESVSAKLEDRKGKCYQASFDAVKALAEAVSNAEKEDLGQGHTVTKVCQQYKNLYTGGKPYDEMEGVCKAKMRELNQKEKAAATPATPAENKVKLPAGGMAI
jgi:hypothetical protein